MSSVSSLCEIHDLINEEHNKEVAYREKFFSEKKGYVDKFYCFLQECLGAGYVPRYNQNCIVKWNDYCVTVDNMKDFSTIHKIVGTLHQSDIRPLKDDARCRKVEIVLVPKSKEWNFLRFIYNKTLPRGAKCKVKSVVSRRTVVQCER